MHAYGREREKRETSACVEGGVGGRERPQCVRASGVNRASTFAFFVVFVAFCREIVFFFFSSKEQKDSA